MGSSTEEIGTTENVILALLDFLVDPLLPTKSSSSSRDALSPSQEELVAKQMHAVAVLYNYYHRKQYSELQFLEFESFCKMSVTLKPSLLPYLRLMQRPDHKKVDELDKELSLTEKAIINACDVCKSLDASKKNPKIDGWPIIGVVVFLVDDKKEHCFLFHSFVTQGVWSAIEKDFNCSSPNAEAVVSRSGDKKKRVGKRLLKENQSANEASLQQLAYSAVKEACGISQGDLKTLENHVVYSISKEKTAVCLYIMQCTITNQNMNLVPITDAMESLQGPLVRKESGSWIATPVVEYFHLLHFIDHVSDWLFREGLLSIPRNIEVQKEARSYDSLLSVAPQPNTSNHFIAINGVENNLSPSKEEPLMSISQSVEAVIDVSNESCQLENNFFPDKLPQGEAAKDADDNDMSNLMEQVDNTAQPSSLANGIQSKSCQLKNGTHQLKDEPISNSPPHTEIEYKVEDGSSSHLNEEPAKDKSRNGRCQLKEEGFLHNSSHSETAKKDDCQISSRKRNPSETVVYTKRKRSQRNCNLNKSPGSKKSIATMENSGQGDRECAVTISLNTIDIDEAVTTCSQVDGKRKNLHCEIVDSHEQLVLADDSDQFAFTGADIVVAEVNDALPISYEQNGEKVFSDIKILETATSIFDEKEEHALVFLDPNLECLQKMQLTISSKEALLSETALKVLFKKREMLCQQLRSISDDIALCDRNIQTILNGGEDDLAVKIDVVIEGCSTFCLKSAELVEDWTNLHIINPELPPVIKKKRLSEANLCVHSPCQELDGVCYVNGWTLPTYNVSASKGGFQAIVTMKGPDFECSSEASTCTTPHESRNLAASKLLEKLRGMAADLS